jgi:hypothetical protein
MTGENSKENKFTSEASEAAKQLRFLEQLGIREQFEAITIGLSATSEDSWLRALQTLAPLFPKPIFNRRWPQVRGALRERAGNQGISPKQALAEAVHAALVEALVLVREEIVNELAGRGLTLGGVRGRLREHLNRLISDDLLGPGWRRYAEGKEVAELGQDERWDGAASIEDELLSWEDALALLPPDLSPREIDLVIALARGAETTAEAADELEIAHSTGRVLLSRIREKTRR